MADAQLPAEFSDLEPFVKDWCLDSEPERYAKRLSSAMDEIQEFYDAIFPRAEDAIQYLEKFPLHELPDDAFREAFGWEWYIRRDGPRDQHSENGDAGCPPWVSHARRAPPTARASTASAARAGSGLSGSTRSAARDRRRRRVMPTA